MEISNTENILQRFYAIAGNLDPSPEDKEFMRYYQFSLAKAISEDFREDAVIVAKMILAYFE